MCPPKILRAKICLSTAYNAMILTMIILGALILLQQPFYAFEGVLHEFLRGSHLREDRPEAWKIDVSMALNR